MRTMLKRSAVPVIVLLLAVPQISAAQARNRNAGDDGGSSGQAVPRGSVPAPAPAPAPAAPAAPAPAPTPAPAGDSGAAGRRSSPQAERPADSSSGITSQQGARPREGRATVGTAVPRGSVPRPPRPEHPIVVVPPYYGSYWPWGFGGLGFAGYYGGYYSGFYDPFYPYDEGYGYGGYSGYGYPASSYTAGFEGALRLKIRPRDAQVFVDGYYAGIVDDFDGVFQRLRIEAGPHRIEIRAPGFAPLTFDVRVRFDETTDLEGELQRLP
jgi:hypothetical protein